MNKKNHSKLWIYFIGVVFGTVLLGGMLMLCLRYLLYYAGLSAFNPADGRFPVILIVPVSVIIGSVITLFVGRWIIYPIQTIRDAFSNLADGDFDVRVPENGKIAEIRNMEECFNAMAHDLSNVETLRNDFVVNVSHEFKTPIAAIEGYAALLQNTNLSLEKHQYYVGKILSNVRRLSSLSSNVLTLSKLENQETVMHQKYYRLDEQIRKAILLLEDKWSEKEIELEIDLPRLSYYGNESLLDQVWYNLLDNAVKHSPQHGVIRASLEAETGAVSVSISDQGEGMTEDVQKHIFEKFYQGDRSRSSEGNGLGLALVKRILDLCRGTVTVQSEPGRGSTFTVRLPLDGD